MGHEDEAAERAWHDALHDLGAGEGDRGQTVIPFTPWRLVARHALNPGSPALTAYHLQFEPVGTDVPEWQAGDIVELHPCNAPEAVEALLASQAPEGDLIAAPAALRAELARAMLPDAGTPLTMAAARALRPCRRANIRRRRSWPMACWTWWCGRCAMGTGGWASARAG
ncbi:hypothetical protein ACFSUK_25595 [Sphingobium scionense]